MDVEIARSSGFCWGVKRSVDLVERDLNASKKVYLAKLPVHNNVVVNKLTAKGANVVQEIEEVPNGETVFFRSHGEPPASFERAKAKNLKVVDLTCPFVMMVHRTAKRMEEEGYLVVVVGDKEHPEVKGILGHTKKGVVIQTPEEARAFVSEEQYATNDELDKQTDAQAIDSLFSYKLQKVAVVVQTTQENEKFNEIVKILNGKAREVRAFNTICNATHTRQPSAEELAKRVDLMIVIGGKMTANTKHLNEIAYRHTKSYWIETVADLKSEWFSGAHKAGITAGASTPQESIDEVRAWIEKI